jgi:hypothetical protein
MVRLVSWLRRRKTFRPGAVPQLGRSRRELWGVATPQHVRYPACSRESGHCSSCFSARDDVRTTARVNGGERARSVSRSSGTLQHARLTLTAVDYGRGGRSVSRLPSAPSRANWSVGGSDMRGLHTLAMNPRLPRLWRPIRAGPLHLSLWAPQLHSLYSLKCIAQCGLITGASVVLHPLAPTATHPILGGA